MYKETVFSKYHSNVVGSTVERSHPAYIEIEGKRIEVGEEVRMDALERDYYEGRKSLYHEIVDGVEFRILSFSEKDCDRTISRIRWRVPKNAKFVY